MGFGSLPTKIVPGGQFAALPPGGLMEIGGLGLVGFGDGLQERDLEAPGIRKFAGLFMAYS